MKVQITCTVPDKYLAGLVYDLPADEAQELILQEMAIAVMEDEPIMTPQPKRKTKKGGDE